MRRRSRRAGQSMVELAIILPLMMVIFLGSWTAADLIGDNQTALQATRAGARYAAELGAAAPTTTVTAFCGATTQPDTCQVDDQIIQQMLPIVVGSMPNAVVNEIDIYQPDGGGGPDNPGCGAFSSTCPPDNGAYIPPSELIDKYTFSGSTITAASTAAQWYLLSDRYQVPPDEAELGVRIVFTYTSPTLKMFTQTDSRYTVVRLAPEE